MKKSFIAFLLLLGMASNYAFAEGNSIAVVDLQKLVSNSAQVKQLKQEHSKKMEELNKIIVNARGAIANETDSAKIVQLEEKYTREYNTKKQALEKVTMKNATTHQISLSTREQSIVETLSKYDNEDPIICHIPKSPLSEI